MIALKYVDGKWVENSAANIPIPHSLTRVAKKSGNYGLADEARRRHPEMALGPGELPSVVLPKKVVRDEEDKTGEEEWSREIGLGAGLGRGRGRGRILGKASGGQQEMAGASGMGSLPQLSFDDPADAAAYQRVCKVFLSGVADKYDEEDFAIFEDYDGNNMDATKAAREKAWHEVVKEHYKGLAQKDQTEGGQRQDYDGGFGQEAEGGFDQEDQFDVQGASGQEYQIYRGYSPCRTKSELDAEWESAGAMPTTSSASTVPQSAKSLVKATKAKAMKTNGYCLFLKHKARETGNTGTINELMRIFDKDWKSLPEEEKKNWKLRAKTGGGRGPPSSGRGDGSGYRTGAGHSGKRSCSFTSTTTQSTTGTLKEDSDDGY